MACISIQSGDYYVNSGPAELDSARGAGIVYLSRYRGTRRAPDPVSGYLMLTASLFLLVLLSLVLGLLVAGRGDRSVYGRSS